MSNLGTTRLRPFYQVTAPPDPSRVSHFQDHQSKLEGWPATERRARPTAKGNTAMTSGNGDVQTITSVGKGAANKVAADSFKEYMLQRAEVQGEGLSFEIASGQVAKILEAANSDNEQDLWDADELDMLNGMDMTDVEQKVNRFTVHKATGEVENPWGVFIVVQATRLSDGADIAWNTGAISVVSKLRAFEARGAFPLECVIRGTKSGKGTVLKLRPIPARAVQASTK